MEPLDHLSAAAEKDAGLDPSTLAWVLASVPTDPSALLMVKPLEPETLAAFRDRLINDLQRLAWPTR